MTLPLVESTILVIGNDPPLAYLLGRYAEQSGCRISQYASAPWIGELRQLKPIALIFLSLEYLQTAQSLVEDLSLHETPVLVCASLSDEARARELGADACLFHPLTYDDFCSALSSIDSPRCN